MSAVASSAKSDVVTEPAAMDAGSTDLMESPSDTHETKMAYGPSSGIPVLVILVWVCALTCLGIYCVSFYYPDLAAWRKP